MTRREKERLADRVLRAAGFVFGRERRALLAMTGAELELVALLAERAAGAGRRDAEREVFDASSLTLAR